MAGEYDFTEAIIALRAAMPPPFGAPPFFPPDANDRHPLQTRRPRIDRASLLLLDAGPELTATPEQLESAIEHCQGIGRLKGHLAERGWLIWPGDSGRLVVAPAPGSPYAASWPIRRTVKLARVLVAAGGSLGGVFAGEWEAQHWCHNCRCANVNHLGAIPGAANAADNGRFLTDPTPEVRAAERRWEAGEVYMEQLYNKREDV